jgi:hypothetical protein
MENNSFSLSINGCLEKTHLELEQDVVMDADALAT